MNAKRLLKLAAFLRQLPPHKFNFDVITYQVGKPMAKALAAREEHCGTVACAIGWLPAVFPRSVLWDSGSNVYTYPLVVLKRDLNATNFTAAQKLFGLDYHDSRYLFDPDRSGLGSNATAVEVAAHIEQFVKQGGIPAPDYKGRIL
jgi:hypothetical protein